MKNKAPLALMELTLMVLVFALAAALCLRAFVWSNDRSVRNEARDRALLQAQSAAEVLKHTRGSFSGAQAILGGGLDGAAWKLCYDEQWEPVQAPAPYTLSVHREDSGQPLLGRARVDVTDGGGDLLAQLTVCWQEVDGHG